MNTNIVDDLSEEGAKKILKLLIAKLDECDEEDMLGTEGWRHFVGMED